MAEQLIVGITAQDNATPVFEKFKNSLKNVQTQIGQTQSGMGDFTKTLTEQLGKLPGLSDATNVLGNAVKLLKNPYIEGALAIGTATAAMIKFANANESNVMALSKMSAQTGISINSLQALKKIGAESDTSIESMSAAVGKLEKNMGSNSKALKKLGIDAKDPIEAMAQVADKFAATTDPIERATIGTAAFGKSWQELAPVLAQGGDALRKAKDASSISEGMVDRYKEMHHNQLLINGAFGAWKGLLGDIASGPLSVVYEKLAGLAKYAKEVATDLRRAIGYSADKNKLGKMTDESSLAGEKAGNNLSRSKTGLDFSSHYDSSKAQSASDSTLLASFKKLSADEQSTYVTMLAGWSEEELKNKKITTSTIAKLQDQYQKTKADESKPHNSGEATKKTGVSEEVTEQIKAIQQMTEADRKAEEEIAKVKNQIIVDGIADQREKEHVALSQKYQDEESKANGNKELLLVLWEKYRQDSKLIDDKYDKEDLAKKIANLNKQIEAQEKVTKTADEKKKKAEEELKKTLEAEKKQWEEISKTIENALSSPYSNFIKEVSRGNKSLFSSFKSLASGMKDAFGNAVVEMVAKYLAQKSAMYVTDLAMQAASTVKSLAIGSAATTTATAESVAAGATAAAANAPAAALASTWSFGSAAIAGGVALAAILALAKSSYAVGSTNIPYDQIAQIHKGEIIIPAKESQAARSGNLSPMLDFIGQNPSTTSSNSSPSDVSNSPINVNINGTNLTSKKVATQVVNELRYYQKQNAWRRN